MKYSVQIHPDSLCYNGFSQYIIHHYYKSLEGKESPLIFKEDQKISSALVHIVKLPAGDDKVHLHFAFGARNDNVSFTYKDEEFNIEVFVRKDLANIERGCERFYVFFNVTFDNMKLFEELGLVVKEWHTKFLDDKIRKQDKILIYTNDEMCFRRTSKKPMRSLDSILLPEDDKSGVIDKITNFIKPETRKLYERLGKNYKLIILFHGLPGTGKTSFIHAIASHFGRDIAVYAHEKKNGDTQFGQLMRTIGDKILCLEDMDCLFNTRETEDKTGITFSGIINTLDGFLSPYDDDDNPFLCFITTNCIDKLDKTLIRPGRVDHFLEFCEIKKAERRKMFVNYFGEERADEFEKAFSSLKTKVTPATLDMYLFGYLNDPAGAIENISNIIKMKELTSSASNRGMYS